MAGLSNGWERCSRTHLLFAITAVLEGTLLALLQVAALHLIVVQERHILIENGFGFLQSPSTKTVLSVGLLINMFSVLSKSHLWNIAFEWKGWLYQNIAWFTDAFIFFYTIVALFGGAAKAAGESVASSVDSPGMRILESVSGIRLSLPVAIWYGSFLVKTCCIVCTSIPVGITIVVKGWREQLSPSVVLYILVVLLVAIGYVVVFPFIIIGIEFVKFVATTFRTKVFQPYRELFPAFNKLYSFARNRETGEEHPSREELQGYELQKRKLFHIAVETRTEARAQSITEKYRGISRGMKKELAMLKQRGIQNFHPGRWAKNRNDHLLPTGRKFPGCDEVSWECCRYSWIGARDFFICVGHLYSGVFPFIF
jgi:hypothetical protein